MAILLYYIIICYGNINLPYNSFFVSNPSDCKIDFNGIDLETKIHRIEIAKSLLFNYTPPEVKNDLQQSNLMFVNGQIVQEGEQVALHLNIRINSKIAPQHYGAIQANSLLKITLINGREVKLKCYAASEGVLTREENGYIYPLGYNLDKKHLKQLARFEIDKLGLQWTSGYEEYPIYEVDFFINQISCLRHAQNSN